MRLAGYIWLPPFMCDPTHAILNPYLLNVEEHKRFLRLALFVFIFLMGRQNLSCYYKVLVVIFSIKQKDLYRIAQYVMNNLRKSQLIISLILESYVLKFWGNLQMASMVLGVHFKFSWYDRSYAYCVGLLMLCKLRWMFFFSFCQVII